MSNELLAIIPARAGSKGVPGKNKAMVGGKLLIDYTTDAVVASNSVSGIILTTDDIEILNHYQHHKDVFLIQRPAELARDQSKTSDAIAHAINLWLESGHQFPDAILLAQPTTPLRTSEDIDNAFELFVEMGKLPTISACKVEGIRHPRVMYIKEPQDSYGKPYIEDADLHLQRQDYEILYQRNGAVYIVATEYFLQTGQLRSSSPIIYEMPWERSINIDTLSDLRIAKALIESTLT